MNHSFHLNHLFLSLMFLNYLKYLMNPKHLLLKMLSYTEYHNPMLFLHLLKVLKKINLIYLLKTLLKLLPKQKIDLD